MKILFFEHRSIKFKSKDLMSLIILKYVTFYFTNKYNNPLKMFNQIENIKNPRYKQYKNLLNILLRTLMLFYILWSKYYLPRYNYFTSYTKMISKYTFYDVALH